MTVITQVRALSVVHFTRRMVHGRYQADSSAPQSSVPGVRLAASDYFLGACVVAELRGSSLASDHRSLIHIVIIAMGSGGLRDVVAHEPRLAWWTVLLYMRWFR